MTNVQPSTVGAGKSGAESQERLGPDSATVWAVAVFLLIVVSPLAVIVFGVAVILGRLRRVRFTRMLLWVLAALLVTAFVSGFNPAAAVSQYVAGWLGLINIGGLAQQALNALCAALAIPPPILPDGASIGRSLIMQLPLAAPFGLLLAALSVGWAAWRRAPLAELEEKRFDFTRPFGIVDWIRRAISRRLIARAFAVSRRRGTIAIGTGRYGHIVHMSTQELQRTTFVFGRIRSGKTALACSLIWQAAEGGIIVINFKGEGDGVAEGYARWAKANGRVFQHFTLADKSGADYLPPIDGLPTAAQSPSCYDPLRYGNADSKASMLQKSVDREGDAAAYLRHAEEFTLIAYQVAAITGLDRDRSGFQVLHDLCDMGALLDALLATDPATGRPCFNPADPAHQRIRQRVELMDKQWAKDVMLRSAVENTRALLSSYMNGAAAGPLLRVGPTRDQDIDLVRAITEGHVVVFSLPVQAYPELSKTIGTMVLLDLQNGIDTLRGVIRRNGGTRPWKPAFLHVEEFGSAGSDAILDVLNKSGDVGINPVLSSQAYEDLTRMNGGEPMARSIIAQAGNTIAFGMTSEEGAAVVANMTREAKKKYPRSKKEFAGGLFGVGLRAADTGQIEPTIEKERHVSSGDIQRLAERKRHYNQRATRARLYECLWIANYDGGRAAHTYTAYANNWFERIVPVLCDPTATARRFESQVKKLVNDVPLTVASHEVARADHASSQDPPLAEPPPPTSRPQRKPAGKTRPQQPPQKGPGRQTKPPRGLFEPPPDPQDGATTDPFLDRPDSANDRGPCETEAARAETGVTGVPTTSPDSTPALRPTAIKPEAPRLPDPEPQPPSSAVTPIRHQDPAREVADSHPSGDADSRENIGDDGQKPDSSRDRRAIDDPFAL